MIQLHNFSIDIEKFKLENINLHIKKGEIFAVLGITGSGKTVLLESLAGFYSTDKGKIFMGGRDMYCIPPEKRNIGFVYQDYSLFPHLTVYKNIEFGLKLRKTTKNECLDKIDEIIKFLSIDHLIQRYPSTLSGGEKQRTALARALVLNPQILLMDEPFSALDTNTKETIIDVVKDINKAYNCTIVFVTHDINEAKKLADRVGIISNGNLKSICDISELNIL